MAKSGEIRNVAIVGTGVIGASWAALYLARGLNVVATDPAPNAEANLRRYIDGGVEGLDGAWNFTQRLTRPFAVYARYEGSRCRRRSSSGKRT